MTTADLWAERNSKPARRVPRELWPVVHRKLTMLDSAQRLEDLAAVPGDRVEALAGSRKGRHSIRVNQKYRLTFRWENNDAYEVYCEDSSRRGASRGVFEAASDDAGRRRTAVGDEGMDILATGFPVSTQIACAGGTPVDAVEETVAAGGSSLSYDSTTGNYVYGWKSDRSWSSTCRQFTLKLKDGTIKTPASVSRSKAREWAVALSC